MVFWANFCIMNIIIIQITLLMFTFNSPMNFLVYFLILIFMLSIDFVFLMKNYWTVILIFLILVSGLLVLFLYIISLMPKKNTKTNHIPLIALIPIIVPFSMPLNYIQFDKMMYSFMTNPFLVLNLSALIFFMVQISSKFINAPFKTMKTS